MFHLFASIYILFHSLSAPPVSSSNANNNNGYTTSPCSTVGTPSSGSVVVHGSPQFSTPPSSGGRSHQPSGGGPRSPPSSSQTSSAKSSGGAIKNNNNKVVPSPQFVKPRNHASPKGSAPGSVERAPVVIPHPFRPEAQRKLALLKQKCPVCNSTGCSGEDCLGRACFKCHDPDHMAPACPFDHRVNNEVNSLDVFLNTRGFCNWCLGEKRNTEPHGPGVGGIAKNLHCPLKRKLKRAIGLKFHHGNTSEQVSWLAFLRSIYSSDDNYYEFVAGLDIGGTAPTLR